MTQYYVKNGNTLGYVMDGQPGIFGVLRGNPLKGGDDWINGPIALTDGDVLKAATLADFDAYRVDATGHDLTVR